MYHSIEKETEKKKIIVWARMNTFPWAWWTRWTLSPHSCHHTSESKTFASHCHCTVRATILLSSPAKLEIVIKTTLTVFDKAYFSSICATSHSHRFITAIESLSMQNESRIIWRFQSHGTFQHCPQIDHMNIASQIFIHRIIISRQSQCPGFVQH